MTNASRRTFCGSIAALPLLAQRAFAAEDYPSRPIRIIVPYPGGDGTDVITRVLAQQMQKDLKVPIVISNVTGAAGLIGALSMANSPPDGYTISLLASSHITHQTLYKKYDLFKQSVPISSLATAPFCLMVSPQSRFRTAEELLKAIREQPGRISMATGGYGSAAHMAFEVLATKVGDIKVNHVPYKSGLESAQAAAAGQCDFASTYIGGAAPMIKSGLGRALAVTSARRLAPLPDVPTIAETIAPNYDYNVLLFYGAPPKTPAPIVDALAKAIASAARSPELAILFDTLAHQLHVSKSSGDLNKELQAAITAEENLIRDRGIKVES